MKMKIGDKVETLNDTVSGIVKVVAKNEITIESEEGFLLKYRPEELVVTGKLELDDYRVNQAIHQKNNHASSHKKQSKAHQNDKTICVDLHLAEILSSSKHIEDYQILDLQLRKAIDKLEFAIEQHIKKVIFIHGVGQGILRRELRKVLSRYEQVQFQDADFKIFGIRGATEVYIYQNY